MKHGFLRRLKNRYIKHKTAKGFYTNDEAGRRWDSGPSAQVLALAELVDALEDRVAKLEKEIQG